MKIRATQDTSDADWLALRNKFIPEVSIEQQRVFLADFARASAGFCGFVATDETGRPCGFAEVSIRTDYVNGCQHRPALFLEGIYVCEEDRGRGIARALCSAAEAWGHEHDCREFASDVYLDDHDSLAAHRGLGFKETEQVVYFRKPIMPA